MYKLAIISLAALCAITLVDPASAASGGGVASSVFASVWGRLLLVGLLVYLFTLSASSRAKQREATRRSVRDLAFMATIAPQFEWLHIRECVLDGFHKAHDAWMRDDTSSLMTLTSESCPRHHVVASFDRWQREGLLSQGSVKVIGITPLLFAHRNEQRPHNGSQVFVSILVATADAVARAGDEAFVCEGEKDQELEMLWTFVLEDGSWKISTIDDISLIVDYLKRTRDLPDVQDTLQPSAATSSTPRT